MYCPTFRPGSRGQESTVTHLAWSIGISVALAAVVSSLYLVWPLLALA